MMVPHHDAYFAVRKSAGAVQWHGQRRFFRGHRLEPGPGERPDGVYAQWTWDGDALTVQNDRYGVAPLFFMQHGRDFAISPSIATLLALGAPREIDETALAVFFRLGFFVGDDTPFRHIRAVPPAATLCWRDGALSMAGGYTTPRALHISRDEALDGFVALFHQAMARRLPADDRAVVPLSGGRDSRHILFELCALGRPPRCAVTIPRYPPRAREDERIAPLVAAAADVPHVLQDQDDSRFHAELAKNWGTHLCADEHAWYMRMVDALGSATTVYDGLGGALSVPSRFLSRDVLRLFEAGRTIDLAERLLAAFSLFDEAFLANAVIPAYRAATSRERAVERLSAELARHAGAADPVKSFNFWNRIRRELALVPYALMHRVPHVYTPYLDRGVFDFMMALAPEVMSPALASGDKSFHTDAIHRAFPQHAQIPFEDKSAPAVNAAAHQARFARDVARYLFSNVHLGSRLLNRAYVLPRLAAGVLRPRYSASRPWLPSLALYLFQLDAMAAGAAAMLRSWAATAPSVRDVIATTPAPARTVILPFRGRRSA